MVQQLPVCTKHRLSEKSAVPTVFVNAFYNIKITLSLLNGVVNKKT